MSFEQSPAKNIQLQDLKNIRDIPKIIQALQSIRTVKGDKGDLGERGPSGLGVVGRKGERGESIMGPRGPRGFDGMSIRGRDGKDGKDAPAVNMKEIEDAVVERIPVPKDGKDGKDGESIVGPAGRDGKDAKAEKGITETKVKFLARQEVKKIELPDTHPPEQLGTVTVDEKNIGEDKILQYKGDKLEYVSLPKTQAGGMARRGSGVDTQARRYSYLTC